jgi:prepilin-type N-terminal cleavage/methylation domain-containing protein
MTTTNRLLRGSRGFTLMELIVVMGIIAVIGALGSVVFANVSRAMATRGAAAEMKAVLQRAKQLAITRRQNICVQVVSGTVQYRLNTCGGTGWAGPGTTSNGTVQLANNATITNTGAMPIFTPTGTLATAQTTFTVTPASGAAVTVTVTPAGRITSP